MRLSKIVTRTGDKGTTGLADKSRVAKDHPRIAVLGTIDELSSQIGVLLAEPVESGIKEVLLKVQNDLFDLGGAISLPERDIFDESRVEWLDEQIAHYNADLPPLREFILPGGSRAGALCHVVRTVARRAERDLVTLANSGAPAEGNPEAGHQSLPQHALPYLNRLSDLLFVLARCINRSASTPEVIWKHEARK